MKKESAQMKRFLCSVALLVLCATSQAIFGQEYDERPRPPRRVGASNANATPRERTSQPASNINVATSDVLRAVRSTNTPVASDTPAREAAENNVASLDESSASADAASSAPPTTASTNPVAGVASAPVTTPVASTPVAASSAVAVPLTSIYRVGEGDILDIRILNYEVQSASTLYSVLGGGLLEYPLIGEPLVVKGLTTDEINARVTNELKRRAVFDDPQVVVSVRDYVSHTATVSGLVENPGAKVLRREALPLYVVLAEATPRPEAGQVVITSPTSGATRTIDLADAAASNTLVHAGDVLRVMVRPPQFFYVGGEVIAPGQKDFHAGLTLTQAVLTAGGASRSASGRVRVARQGQDGRLLTTEYNLKEIEAGRVPDPVLQSGDRIELNRK